MRRIQQLFARLAAIYGHIWQSQFKQPDVLKIALKTWGLYLQKYTNLELAFGVRKCIADHPLPPTLPQFIAACRVTSDDLKITSFDECFVKKNTLYQQLIKRIPTFDRQKMSHFEHRRALRELYDVYVGDILSKYNEKHQKLKFLSKLMQTPTEQISKISKSMGVDSTIKQGVIGYGQ